MKTKLSVMLVCFMFLFSGSAFAIAFTTYGDPDLYNPPPMTGPNFGDANVLTFVNAFLAPKSISYTVGDVTKFDGLGSGNLISIGEYNNTNYWAFDFGDLRPEYYMFKQGNAGYLYENVNSKRYAVTTFNDVSHITAFGGTPVSVPEPTTLLLFGAGIAGLAMYRRKRS